MCGVRQSVTPDGYHKPHDPLFRLTWEILSRGNTNEKGVRPGTRSFERADAYSPPLLTLPPPLRTPPRL